MGMTNDDGEDTNNQNFNKNMQNFRESQAPVFSFTGLDSFWGYKLTLPQLFAIN